MQPQHNQIKFFISQLSINEDQELLFSKICDFFEMAKLTDTSFLNALFCIFMLAVTLSILMPASPLNPITPLLLMAPRLLKSTRIIFCGQFPVAVSGGNCEAFLIGTDNRYSRAAEM